MDMLRDNFIGALQTAIYRTTQLEKEAGYQGDSGYLQGLKQVLKAAENNEEINIID